MVYAYSASTSSAPSNKCHLVEIIIAGYMWLKTILNIRFWGIDYKCTQYISELIWHSKKYDAKETILTHWMMIRSCKNQVSGCCVLWNQWDKWHDISTDVYIKQCLINLQNSSSSFSIGKYDWMCVFHDKCWVSILVMYPFVKCNCNDEIYTWFIPL